MRLKDSFVLVHILLIYIFTILAVFTSSTFLIPLIIITLLWILTVVMYMHIRRKEEIGDKQT